MKEASIIKAHKHSALHREEVLNSDKVGCFYCLKIYQSIEIKEWIDEDDSDVGQTAICDKCAIDSVIGDKSGYLITEKFLGRMKSYWF